MDLKEVGYEKNSSCSRPVAGSCEHGNETPVSLKGGKPNDQQSNYQPLKKDFAMWC
jgi:hypothetical protein